MIRNFIPGALALGLIVTSSAAEKPATAEAPANPEAAAVQEAPALPAVDPATMKADSSYALGFRAGAEFSRQFAKYGVTPDDLDSQVYIKAFMEAFKGEKPSVDETKLQAAMAALAQSLGQREKTIGAAALEEGKKFLAENGKRKGVITTKSGLQYEVLTKGGEEKYVAPKGEKEEKEENKQFLVNYKGSLISGKQFDASPEGKPVPMTLQVVPGFKEALTTMPVGAKWKLFIPAELGYGEQRMSPDLGPNSTLIFEVELVKIEDAPAQPSMPFQMPEGAQPAGE